MHSESKRPRTRLGARHHDRFAPLDDDLSPGAYPRQHIRKVAGGFRFRDVDDVLRHRQHYIARQ